MFKPLPNNIVGTVSNTTRYATQLIVSQNIYDAVLSIAGDWTYLCLIVGKELEVVKVVGTAGVNTIQVVRGMEGTNRLVLANTIVKYMPTISSIYDIASTVEPIEIVGEEGVIVDGYAINYPRLHITSEIDGIGVIEENNNIIFADIEGYIGCKEHICPGEDTFYALILTSRPYAVEDIENVTSRAVSTRGSILYRIIESMESALNIIDASIYGGLKAFTAPHEDIDSTMSISTCAIYGGLISFSNIESMESALNILEGSIYGNLVSYSMNENMNSTCDVVFGSIT
jgi:hypothetical protein